MLVVFVDFLFFFWQVPSHVQVGSNFFLSRVLVISFMELFSPIGTSIVKGELRLGTIVDMRGMQTL